MQLIIIDQNTRSVQLTLTRIVLTHNLQTQIDYTLEIFGKNTKFSIVHLPAKSNAAGARGNTHVKKASKIYVHVYTDI